MPRQKTGAKNGRPKKSKPSSDQSRALVIEVLRAKQVSTDGIKGSILARIMGVTRAAVSKWRKDPIYQAYFSKLLGQHWSKILEQKWHTPVGEYWMDPNFKVAPVDPESLEQQRKRQLRKEAVEYIEKDYSINVSPYVKRNWLGPFNDVHSGEHFQTADQYFDFLLKNHFVPSGLIDEIVEMLRRARRK